jgi:trehalose 6-phosphate synthase
MLVPRSQVKNRVVRHEECSNLQQHFLQERNLIIASNRGPVTFFRDEDGQIKHNRGGGGLVTALMGMTQQVESCWVACALSPDDRQWDRGTLILDREGDQEHTMQLIFLPVEEQVYEGYYNVIANPLLWFLQHSMWDTVRSPTINHATWQAWEEGYVRVNQQFAYAIAEQINNSQTKSLVMLQDYHLYLLPKMLRELVEPNKSYTLTHFVHIPWPGPEDWGMLPGKMRRGILEGLCALDLLGFQTREDGLNFIRTCESHLPEADVTFKYGRVWHDNHATYVRDFPISIDVDALHRLADSDEVKDLRQQLELRFGGHQLIVRIDRTEPSKNIVRGFLAFDEMLEIYPEHRGKVQFLALLVPSRMEVEEYQNYLDELMAGAGRVNVRHGDSNWEPVRVLVGENYPRAVAALQMYDVLLVNSVADGMNLVAKEGPTVNLRDGVVILSERTGARQQLETGSLVISPWDIYATAEAMHQALTMPAEERRERAQRLRDLIEREDIEDWLCRQLESIQELAL